MATSNRLRGNQGLVFKLKTGAGTSTSYADDVKSHSLLPEEADDSDLTFYEAQNGGGAKWVLSITGVTSYDANSLFKYLDDKGGTEFDVVYGPWGNATASATQPHKTFKAVLALPPGFEREAATNNEGAEFEVEFNVVGQPVTVVA